MNAAIREQQRREAEKAVQEFQREMEALNERVRDGRTTGDARAEMELPRRETSASRSRWTSITEG